MSCITLNSFLYFNLLKEIFLSPYKTVLKYRDLCMYQRLESLGLIM